MRYTFLGPQKYIQYSHIYHLLWCSQSHLNGWIKSLWMSVVIFLDVNRLNLWTLLLTCSDSRVQLQHSVEIIPIFMINIIPNVKQINKYKCHFLIKNTSDMGLEFIQKFVWKLKCKVLSIINCSYQTLLFIWKSGIKPTPRVTGTRRVNSP